MSRKCEATVEPACNATGHRWYQILAMLVATVGTISSGDAQTTVQPALFPFVRQLKTGFIDIEGKVVIDPQFDVLSQIVGEQISFAEGLQPMAKAMKWGYIDRRGLTRIPFRFALAEPFSEGLAAVQVITQRGGGFVPKYGYIDHTGGLVIPAEFDYVGKFSEGLAPIVRNGEMGYIDKKGAAVIKPQFASWSEEISPFSEGLAGVQQKTSAGQSGTGLWGFIDKTGSWVLPPRYRTISAFHDGFAAVEEQGEPFSKYIDHTGKTAAGPFNMAWAFSEGLARVTLPDGRKAFINRKGNLEFVLEKSVSWVEPFSEGMAKATIRTEPDREQQVGYVDRSGKLTIPAIYSAGSSFHNGLASVVWCNQSGYIGLTGNAAWGINAQTDRVHRQPSPLPGILTPELIGRIIASPTALTVRESSGSKNCGPFGKRIWSLEISSIDRRTPPPSISLVDGGTLLTDEKIGELRALIEMSRKDRNAENAIARPIQYGTKTIGYASVAGLGPGGSMLFASIFSPDRQYELVVTLMQGHGIRQLQDPLGWISKVTLDTLSALFPPDANKRNTN